MLLFKIMYFLIFIEVLLVGLKTLHYQHQKRKLDKLQYEIIGNLNMAKSLCLLAGYEIPNDLRFISFHDDISNMIINLNLVKKDINYDKIKSYESRFIRLYANIKDRHSKLMLEYNNTAGKINYILDHWPVIFKLCMPVKENFVNDALQLC